MRSKLERSFSIGCSVHDLEIVVYTYLKSGASIMDRRMDNLRFTSFSTVFE